MANGGEEEFPPIACDSATQTHRENSQSWSLSSHRTDGLLCPFWIFYCYPDGRKGSKGTSRLISHIKRIHLCSVERATVLRDAIMNDIDLYLALERTLKTFGQWLCWRCMKIQAVSRACHRDDGLTRVTDDEGVVSGHIVGILKPLIHVVADVTDGLVIDAMLLDRIFKVPITTVKSIPHSCRLAFSQALKTALYQVIVGPGFIHAWVRSLRLPRCTLQIFRPSNRRDRRSGNRKSLQQQLILSSISKWGSADGFTTWVGDFLKSDPEAFHSQNNLVEGNKCQSSNIWQCLRKVSDGHFSATLKVLCSSGVAPSNEHTMKTLEAKHPYKPPPSLPGTLTSETPLTVDADAILRSIKSFPKRTSCGRDGLRAQHILDALCGEGSTVATDLLRAISMVVNLWLGGRCPLILVEFVASAPLTPLLKPGNGIRPIVVGTIWRRLVSKVAMIGVVKEMSKYLNDFQFGVGISGGAEAILHSSNRLLSKLHDDGSLSMLTVDFSNAFNTIDRSLMLSEVRRRCSSISSWVEFIYAQPARLYIGDNHLWSTTGVQQGDLLGPLLFSLALHPFVHEIQDNCKLLLHAWYLDDGTIIGDTLEVAKVLDIIHRKGPEMGLVLNIKKTKLFWPSCDGQKIRKGLFPVDIGRPMLGLRLLGGAVSRDNDFVEDLAMMRVTKAVDLLHLLSQLEDPQSELLLLRSCMGTAKLMFGLRTCQPAYMERAATYFDKGLRGAIEDIVVCGGPFFGDLQWRMASLPIRLGGFGLHSALEASSYAFVASRAQSWVLQGHILRDSGIHGMDSDFLYAAEGLRTTLPSLDLTCFANKDTVPLKPRMLWRADHAQDFLLATPIEGLGMHMSPIEYRTILKYRLMIPLFPADEPCPICHKSCLDAFGEHAVHCHELPEIDGSLGFCVSCLGNMGGKKQKRCLIVAPFKCAWREELRFKEAGRGCVTFEAFAHNDVTLVFREQVGSQHYHYKTDNLPNYTVILGSHRNKRLKIEVDGKTVVDAAGVGLCCSSAFQSYWISVYDGMISIGKGSHPFQDHVFQWLDTKPNCNVQYVGLSSWDKHVGYRNVNILPLIQHHNSLRSRIDYKEYECEYNEDGGLDDREDGFEKWGLADFLESWDLADAFFLVGNEEKLVPAHRIILDASGVFDFHSSERCVISLHSVTYPVLHALLEYIYIGGTQITESQLGSLHELSLQFQVNSLTKLCTEIIDKLKTNKKLYNCGKEVEISFSGRANSQIGFFPLELPIDPQKLWHMYELGENCDVDIYIDDHCLVARAHKIVLSLWSAPFAKMFTNGMSESTSSKIYLKDVSVKALKAMLRFMYTSELEIESAAAISSVLVSLVLLADQFGVAALLRECCKCLSESLSEDSVCSVLNAISSVVACKPLEENCKRKFAMHFDYCTSSSTEFVLLEEGVFSDILQHPDLTVTSEERVLDAILMWCMEAKDLCSWEMADELLQILSIENMLTYRLPALENLLPYVRFPLMPSTLLKKLQRSKLFYEIPILRQLVIEAIQHSEFGIGRHEIDQNVRFQYRKSSFKELQYLCDGDNNGVLYFAGTSYGEHQWVNPVIAKRIAVTASSPSSRYTDPKAFASRTYQGTSFAGPRVENDRNCAWWKVDLGQDHQLMCNYYTLRQDGSSAYIRSWALQGSLDGEHWANLRVHENDQTICRPAQFASWPISGAMALLPFRFFRVFMMAPTTDVSNPWNLCICFMELYGHFR